MTSRIRYELAGYPVNVDAGEDVRVIPVQSGEWPPGVPRLDYWLFDEHDLWLMDYGTGGALRHVEQIEEPDTIAAHLRWRETALTQSIPLADYTAALRRAS